MLLIYVFPVWYPSPINFQFIVGLLLSISLFSSLSTWKIMKDKKRIASSLSETVSRLFKFLLNDLSFTTQLLGAIKTLAMALQLNVLTILPLLWTWQRIFFVRESRKKQLSWDVPGNITDLVVYVKTYLIVPYVCPFILGWDGQESCGWAMVLCCAIVMFYACFNSLPNILYAFLTTEHWADISGNYPELFWDLFHELLM